jgi:hypothetical protein
MGELLDYAVVAMIFAGILLLIGLGYNIHDTINNNKQVNNFCKGINTIENYVRYCDGLPYTCDFDKGKCVYIKGLVINYQGDTLVS